MSTKKSVLEYLAAQIKANGENVFDLALYHRGEWEQITVSAASPAQNAYSVSKAFTATAIGLLRDDGKLSLDDPILPIFAGLLPANLDEKMSRVTVRHLLLHTTGMKRGFLFEGDRYRHGTDDWLSLCLSRPLEHEPGEKQAYSNSNYYLLSRIVRQITGRTLGEFLRERLFTPLGIFDYAWSSCPRGETQGGTGLYINTLDMGKLGLLYLNKGVSGDARLLSEDWCAQATTHQLGGFGYGMVAGEDSFTFLGAYEQIVLAYPARRLILAGHAFTDRFPYAERLEEAAAAVGYDLDGGAETV